MCDFETKVEEMENRKTVKERERGVLKRAKTSKTGGVRDRLWSESNSLRGGEITIVCCERAAAYNLLGGQNLRRLTEEGKTKL